MSEVIEVNFATGERRDQLIDRTARVAAKLKLATRMNNITEAEKLKSQLNSCMFDFDPPLQKGEADEIFRLAADKLDEYLVKKEKQ